MVCRDGTAIKRMCKWLVCPPPVFRACEQGYIQYSLIDSCCWQVFFHPLQIILLGEQKRERRRREREQGRGIKGKKGKTNMYMKTVLFWTCGETHRSLTAWLGHCVHLEHFYSNNTCRPVIQVETKSLSPSVNPDSGMCTYSCTHWGEPERAPH